MTLAMRITDAFLGPVEASDFVRAMIRLSLYDWLICGIAGADEPVSKIIRTTLAGEGGKSDATVFGGPRLPARQAAMVNGTISHALDYDDTHFAHIGHPSVAVFPAAMAVAEAHHVGMLKFLDAALLGAEASIRTGIWLGRSHYEAGFHQTATAGAIGAAVASIRLFDADRMQCEMALGLVGTRASGLKSQFGTMGKPLNAGLAAANGVEAAQLAINGFVAALDGLDGSQGFGPTHAGAGDITAFEGMGSDWLFGDVSHKFHACCHGLHAMLEALQMMPTVAVDKIEEINVTAHPRWASVCNISNPTTGLEAKFSFRQTAAMALCGLPTNALESYSTGAIADEAMCIVRDLVHVDFDESLGETEAVVNIAKSDGSSIQSRYDLMQPISFEDRAQKLRRKGEALVGASLSEDCWEAAQSDDFNAVVAAMSKI